MFIVHPVVSTTSQTEGADDTNNCKLFLLSTVLLETGGFGNLCKIRVCEKSFRILTDNTEKYFNITKF